MPHHPPPSPQEQDWIAVPRQEWEQLAGDVRLLLHQVQGALPVVPPMRRYTLDEVGIRLVQGTDPQLLPEERRTGLDRRTVERLVNAGVLKSHKVGGSRYVTELQVQGYEHGVAAGQIDGYAHVPVKCQPGQPGRKPKPRSRS